MGYVLISFGYLTPQTPNHRSIVPTIQNDVLIHPTFHHENVTEFQAQRDPSYNDGADLLPLASRRRSKRLVMDILPGGLHYATFL